MRCRKVRKMAILYLDRELGSDKEKKVSDHLKTCPRCRRELALLEKSLGIYQEIRKGEQLVDHSPGLILRLRERMEKGLPWWREVLVPTGGRLRRLVYINAVAATVLLSLVFWQSIRKPEILVHIAKNSRILSTPDKTYIFQDGVTIIINSQSYSFKEKRGSSLKSIDMKI